MRKFILLLALIVLLLGCQAVSNVRVGWVEMSDLDSMSATYATFDGTEARSIGVEAGQNVALTYEATAERGTLTMQMVSPDDEIVWEETITEGDSGTAVVTAEQDGRYRLVLVGEDTGGSFDVTWEVQ